MYKFVHVELFIHILKFYDNSLLIAEYREISEIVHEILMNESDIFFKLRFSCVYQN